MEKLKKFEKNKIKNPQMIRGGDFGPIDKRKLNDKKKR